MMSAKRKKDQSSTFSTHIGSVTGPVHTGKGDINIEKFSISNNISTKEEFVSYLEFVRSEIEKAQQDGLPEDIVNKTISELQKAEIETDQEKPQPKTIKTYLENAKSFLLSAAGLATATQTVIETINKLAPHIDQAIQTIGNLFH